MNVPQLLTIMWEVSPNEWEGRGGFRHGVHGVAAQILFGVVLACPPGVALLEC